MLYTKEQLVKLYNDTVMELLTAGYMLTGEHGSRELKLEKGREKAAINFSLWSRECDLQITLINMDTGGNVKKELHYESPSYGANCNGFIYESDQEIITANREKHRGRAMARHIWLPSYWNVSDQYRFTGTLLKYASYIVLPAVKRVKGYARARVDDIKGIARVKSASGEGVYYAVSVIKNGKQETVVLPIKK